LQSDMKRRGIAGAMSASISYGKVVGMLWMALTFEAQRSIHCSDYDT
jgi:hypothetical protein